MVRVTTTNRRGVLRAGAGLVAGGALAAGCADNPAPSHPPATPAPAPPPAASGHPAASPQVALAPRAFARQPAQITHGPRTHPSVALTFHGQGDPALARQLLTEAEKQGARITVLAVGSWLDEHPDLARRILDGGHDLGNHTQRHLAINAMSETDARAEINACADRL